jgi:hypothetical protein
MVVEATHGLLLLSVNVRTLHESHFIDRYRVTSFQSRLMELLHTRQETPFWYTSWGSKMLGGVGFDTERMQVHNKLTT